MIAFPGNHDDGLEPLLRNALEENARLRTAIEELQRERDEARNYGERMDALAEARLIDTRKAEAQLALQQPMIEALAKSHSGVPLERTPGPHPWGIVVFFDTELEASAALDQLYALSALDPGSETT